MIRKDFIEAEIQKLNQILARIMGLKNDGNIEEAKEEALQTLSDSFELPAATLTGLSAEEFETWARERQFSAEKLNLLGQYLFESVYPFEETDETFATLGKTIAVLNLLETEHHQQSLDNISRREQINHFLSRRQYE
ncbi:hypothetical protein [Arcticibacter sp. MXS-1]|uniref:hypothetical protein n=1 Tax=Arcticibacter sp. MXS-1 TaxID=3341726 RepID=UPI0035A96A9D